MASPPTRPPTRLTGPPDRPRVRVRHLLVALLVGAVAGIVLYRRARLEAAARAFHDRYDAA